MYRFIIRPWLFRLDPEEAHCRVLACLARHQHKFAFFENVCAVNDDRLKVELLGLKFRNPIGLAAGLDKHAQATSAWQYMGFGFAEIGTVTPRPQDGNPKPRLFRLAKDQALINRLGFNSVGATVVFNNLSASPGFNVPRGINVGRNRDTPNERAVEDYLHALRVLQPHADYFVINISSPNTTGLRDLQHPDNVHALVCAATQETLDCAARLQRVPPPLFVKLAPDFQGSELEDTVEAALAGGAAGFVATNTTVSRDGLTRCAEMTEAGGISGPPLRQRATETLRRIYRCVKGRVPLIGVGGISSAQDVYERICAGANLVQVYTCMVYEGPTVVRRLNLGLLKLLDRNKVPNVSAAVGVDLRR